MALQNYRGTPVDPVPFLVVAAMAFVVSFSFGPLYGVAVGLSLAGAIYGSAAVFAAVTAGAYYRLVWTARPALRAEVPADVRLVNLFYAAIGLALVLVLLTLPLL